MTVGSWLAEAERQLREENIVSARLDSQLLLEHCTGLDRAWLLAHPEHDLDTSSCRAANGLVRQRQQRIPIDKLIGQREFAGLKLAINEDVLSPRIETEVIVELARQYTPSGSRLLDLGTGSGALAIAIKHFRPDLTVIASEVSPAALKVARGNAKTHGVDIEFVQSDLWQAINGTFQTVVTNLPYLSDKAMSELMDEAKTEPQIALYGGPDGLSLYRKMLERLPEYLEPDGYLFTECDPWQQSDLILEAARYGLRVVEQHYFILGFRRQIVAGF